MMEGLLTPENLIALGTLTALEIVLGIDNIVFISILVGKLPPEQRPKVMRMGLGMAMGMRILLLMAISWIMKLKAVLFTLAGHGFTGKDLIMLGGGLFLMAKATHEIHAKLEGDPSQTGGGTGKAARGLTAIFIQILALDLVFSLDSVITAVGMANNIVVMVAAVVIAVGVMMFSAGTVSAFVEKHPTIKMLGLSFLMLIGVMLTADGFGKHIEKGYIYFAMGFSLAVELLNMKLRKKAKPVELRQAL